ncbi:Trank1, partial [Symbiodinium sp. CCMP2456]
VQMSRWFSWVVNFRQFGKAWTFLKLVHQFRTPELVTAAPGEESEPEGELAAAISGAGRADTKKQDSLQALLQRMRSTRPAMTVAKEVLEEEGLKHKSWMLAAAQLHLLEDHLAMLDACRTIEGSRQLLINWSYRSWVLVVGDILADLSNPMVLDRAGLLRPDDRQEAGKNMQDDAATFLKLTVRAASQRTWSMLVYSDLPPNCWHRLLSSDAESAKGALQEMRMDQEIVDDALEIVRSSDGHPGKE